MALIFADFNKDPATYTEEISYDYTEELGLFKSQTSPSSSGVSAIQAADAGSLVLSDFARSPATYVDAIIDFNELDILRSSAVVNQSDIGTTAKYEALQTGDLIFTNFERNTDTYREVIFRDEELVNGMPPGVGFKIQKLETTLETTEINLDQYWVG